MDVIKIFTHPQFGEIRTAGTAESPEFCAMDLCRALGYVNGRDALTKHVEVEDVAKRDTLTNGGRQQLTYVTESGMYALVLGSQLPDAKKFKRWITSEVLPSIRKHGAYATETTIDAVLADPDNAIRMLTVLKEERQQRELAESKAALLEEVTRLQAPKVVLADAITGSETNILVRDLAKLLCQNGYEIGEIRLYKWLRANKYLTQDNKPMQRYVEQGLFFITEGCHSEKGVMKAHFTTKVTPKGQEYFIGRFLGERPCGEAHGTVVKPAADAAGVVATLRGNRRELTGEGGEA